MQYSWAMSNSLYPLSASSGPARASQSIGNAVGRQEVTDFPEQIAQYRDITKRYRRPHAALNFASRGKAALSCQEYRCLEIRHTG